MNKPNLKYQLFELSGEKFEELCAELLNADFEFDKFFVNLGPNDNGIDISAIKGIKKIAIQVKHRYKVVGKELELEINRGKKLLEYNHEFIFISSAKISQKSIQSFSSEKVKIFAQDDILEMLERHPEISQRYFSNLEKKKKKNQFYFYTSLIGIIITIISGFANIYIEIQSKDETLTNRIDNVEQALKGIKGLENDLKSIKSDMIKTDLENKKILEEYEKMKGLEDIVNDKKESLNIILNYEPWYKTAFKYLVGMIIGIFTSIIASILYERWKLKRELKK